MSNNTSKHTEEEMLDQTFGGYDEEMTAQTEDPHTVKPTTEKKKNNSNIIIFGVGGVAALSVIGYMFLNGKQSSTVTAPPQQSVAVAPQVITPPVVVAQPTTELPKPADAATNFLSDNGNQNPLAGNKDANTPPVNTTITTDNASVSTPTPANTPLTTDNVSTTPSVNTTMTTANVSTPVSTTNPVSTPVVAGNNVVQQQLVSQIKEMFDAQTKEIKSSVEQVGNRVTDLEKLASEQKDVNKSIEDRLVMLESGKKTKSITTDLEKTNAIKYKSIKHVAKKSYKKVRHVVKKDIETTVHTNADNNILVDKSSEKSSVIYPEIQIYSVYAGRVWTKNKDGSLSTFAEGDKLPTGEVVKRVDDEKSQIITDKRVIK